MASVSGSGIPLIGCAPQKGYDQFQKLATEIAKASP